MNSSVIIIGAGGHAKVIIDILKLDTKYEIVGLTDTNPDKQGTKILEVPVIGSDNILLDLIAQNISKAIIAIADNALRRQVFEKIRKFGFEFVNAIHPKTVISPSVKLGIGIAIMAGVVINPESVIKDNTIVNTGAKIDHECRILEHSHVAPGATLCGNVWVGEGAFIGAGSTVIQNVRVGDRAILGAGAVLTEDLEAGVVAIGVPAKPIRKNL